MIRSCELEMQSSSDCCLLLKYNLQVPFAILHPHQKLIQARACGIEEGPVNQ